MFSVKINLDFFIQNKPSIWKVCFSWKKVNYFLTGYMTVSPEMKFIYCNDILQEKNWGICRDACAARIPTDTPSIFLKFLF
jgi:hypothetical protein